MACTGDELELTGVQEMLEREQLLEVPSAFIRPLPDRPRLSSLHPHLDDQLPIIACTHWGFFQVINHGVKDDVVAEMRAACLRFFNQPAKERNKGMASGSTSPAGQASGGACRCHGAVAPIPNFVVSGSDPSATGKHDSLEMSAAQNGH